MIAAPPQLVPIGNYIPRLYGHRGNFYREFHGSFSRKILPVYLVSSSHLPPPRYTVILEAARARYCPDKCLTHCIKMQLSRACDNTRPYQRPGTWKAKRIRIHEFWSAAPAAGQPERLVARVETRLPAPGNSTCSFFRGNIGPSGAARCGAASKLGERSRAIIFLPSRGPGAGV